MAASDQKILAVLQQIENHAKKLSGDSSKVIADRSGDVGGDGKSAFEKSNKGLIQTFIDLNKAIKENRKTITKEAKLLDTAVDKNIQANIAAQDGLNDLANASKKLVKIQIDNIQKLHRANQESQKAFWASFTKGMGAALLTMGARSSQAILNAQGTGFQFAEGVVAKDQDFMSFLDSMGGVWKAATAAFASGSSIEDIQRFASANRATLTTATNVINNTQTAMLTAQEGARAIDVYGQQLLTTFGMTGVSQLTAVGQSLSTLTNLGIVPSMENLKGFGQTIEDLTRTTNMSADQLFAEFAALADNPDYQALFLSMAAGGSVVDTLGKSFLKLQKAVGLNANEFLEYQRFLGKQRKRTGSERIVQAAFVGRAAEMLGTFSPEDIGLLQQGTAFRESIQDPEKLDRFDKLFTKLKKELTVVRGTAAREIQPAALNLIDKVMQKGAIDEAAAIVARDRALVSEAQAAAQDERILASAAATEVMSEGVDVITELVQAFSKSIFVGSGFFGNMTMSIFKGNLMARIAFAALPAAAAIAAGAVFAATVTAAIKEFAPEADLGEQPLFGERTYNQFEWVKSLFAKEKEIDVVQNRIDNERRVTKENIAKLEREIAFYEEKGDEKAAEERRTMNRHLKDMLGELKLKQDEHVLGFERGYVGAKGKIDRSSNGR